MGRGDDQPADPGQIVDGALHGRGMGRVEHGQRFVQQADGGLLHHQPGDQDQLLLAAGQVIERAISEGTDAQTVQRRAGGVQIGGGETG